MGTLDVRSKIASALFGKTRRRILSLLFGQPERCFFLREIVRATHVGQGSVQRELANLLEGEVVTRKERGNQVDFQANAASPIFSELRNLVVKTCGVASVVQQALEGLGDQVEVAFLFGSIVTGEDRAGSDVDVMVVGEVSFGDVVEALGAVEGIVGRPVNPTLYRKGEFLRKLRTKNHFLVQVMKAGKEVVIGDLDDLEAVD